MPQDTSRQETPDTSPASGNDPTISAAGVDFDLGADHTRVDPEAQNRRAAGGATAPTNAAAPANYVALPVGCPLHEYTIEAVLGSGGFGITYLARDNNLQCQVAIKEYLPNDLAIRMEGQTVSPRTESDTHGYRVGLDRFLAETRVLASFRHPNIVRVTRFFEANNTAYMVMDYEKGQPLREWLLDHGPLDEAQLLRMFLPLLEGLEVVHKSGVLHRDIKPANIYVREGDGSLVLLDFGAARHASGGTSRSLTSIVTPGYAPFEQYHTHGAQGPWSDIYAFGGVLYWIVTGEKPVEAPSRIKNDPLQPARTAGAGRYSDKFLAAVDWALTIDEDRRPRSVAEFRAVLTGATPATETAAAPPPAAQPVAPPVQGRRAPSAAIAIAAAAVLVAAAGAYFALRSGKAPEPTATIRQEPEKPAAAEAAAVKKPVAKPKKAATEKSVKPAAAGSEPMATLTFEIVPAGESGDVYVDGKKVGVAPPLRELKVAAGKHKIEIRRISWPGIYHFSVDLQADEKKNIWARLANDF